MNARQARSLLELIADLYTVANTPEPPVPGDALSNGTEKKKEEACADS